MRLAKTRGALGTGIYFAQDISHSLHFSTEVPKQDDLTVRGKSFTSVPDAWCRTHVDSKYSKPAIMQS